MHSAQGHREQPTSNRSDSVGGKRTENYYNQEFSKFTEEQETRFLSPNEKSSQDR